MKLFATSILLLSILPSIALADTAGSTATSSPSLDARVVFISQYLRSAGCPAGNSACDALASTIATEASTSAAIVQQHAYAQATTTHTIAAPIVPVHRALATVVHTGVVSQPAAVAQVIRVPQAASAQTVVALPAVQSLTPAQTHAGNALLQNLPALFVLNALFQHDPSGIITPGGASLGNVIILYQIFYAAHLFAV